MEEEEEATVEEEVEEATTVATSNMTEEEEEEGTAGSEVAVRSDFPLLPLPECTDPDHGAQTTTTRKGEEEEEASNRAVAKTRAATTPSPAATVKVAEGATGKAVEVVEAGTGSRRGISEEWREGVTTARAGRASWGCKRGSRRRFGSLGTARYVGFSRDPRVSLEEEVSFVVFRW